MSAQHIQTSAIFQYDIISFTLHNRECSQAVCTGDSCSSAGNQCTSRVLGDCSGFPAGMNPQLAVLIYGGVTGSTTGLNNLPAPLVNYRVQCKSILVHILVPSLQSGVMCLSVYRLVTSCVNESVPGYPRRPDNLPAIFVYGGGFSNPPDHLTGGHIFRLRTTFCTGVDDGSGCLPAMFNGLVARLVNHRSGCTAACMYPLFTTVKDSTVSLPAQILSSTGTDNRIRGTATCHDILQTVCGDRGVSGSATPGYLLTAGVVIRVRPQLKPGTDSHAISCSGYKLVVMVYQCSAIHCFTRVHNDVSSQHRE